MPNVVVIVELSKSMYFLTIGIFQLNWGWTKIIFDFHGHDANNCNMSRIQQHSIDDVTNLVLMLCCAVLNVCDIEFPM